MTGPRSLGIGSRRSVTETQGAADEAQGGADEVQGCGAGAVGGRR